MEGANKCTSLYLVWILDGKMKIFLVQNMFCLFHFTLMECNALHSTVSRSECKSWPLSSREISGALSAVPGAIWISGQTAFSTCFAIHLTAMQWHLWYSHCWTQVELLLLEANRNQWVKFYEPRTKCYQPTIIRRLTCLVESSIAVIGVGSYRRKNSSELLVFFTWILQNREM